MSSWEGKTRGGTTGYRIFLFLLNTFGIKAAYSLLYFVASYYVVFVPKATKPMRYYFSKVLGFGKLKTTFFLFRNNISFGKALIDKVALLSGVNNNFTFNFEGEKYLHDMAANEGGLIISAHIGNWEIAGNLLERINTKVHIVMLDAEHKKIKALLEGAMTKKTMQVIPILDDMSHLFKIREALKKNEIVAIHGDRFLPGSKTITMNFLGKPAQLPTGPFYIAMKYKKPVVFVSAVKESNDHYHFKSTKPVLYPNSRNVEQKEIYLRKMIGDYIETMEATIRKHPEQWYNYYYFWNT
jgi:predicted LPLAT superfamily acyltransferase